jgi:hypothetical protein
VFDVLTVLKKMSEQARSGGGEGRASKPQAVYGGAPHTLPVGGSGVPSSALSPSSSVLSPGMADPPIDPGLHILPPLQFTAAQQRVHAVLIKYGDILKMSPQEHWDSITGIQGELAIAVDAATNERREEEQKRLTLLPTATAAGRATSNVLSVVRGSSSPSAVGTDVSAPASAPVSSAADSATHFRREVDAAADNLMQHLLDPQQAARSGHRTARHATINHADSSRPLAATGSGPSGAASLTQLDRSFESAFADMQSLLQHQLSSSSAPAAIGSTQSVWVPDHAGGHQDDPDLRSAAAAAALPPLSHLSDLLSGLRRRAEVDSLDLSDPVAAADASAARVSAAPACPAALSAHPRMTHTTHTAGRHGQTHAAHAMPPTDAQTHKPEDKHSSHGRQFGPPSSSVSASVVFPPSPLLSPSRVLPSAAAADATFASSLDPHLPAAVRALRLDEWRQARIASVRDRLVGLQRSDSFFGLLHAPHNTQLHSLAQTHAAATNGHALPSNPVDSTGVSVNEA